MGEVTVRKWASPGSPTEAAILRVLDAEGLRAYSWSNGPHDVYAVHGHSYNKVIYVVDGSITFTLPDLGKELLLERGDRLELPQSIRHGAIVGPHGVTCLEAHL